MAAARRRLTADHLAALALGLLVLAVHDVPYLLSLSFWLDESWVAVTTRFPLSQLPAVTNSTPIGWSALLRLVTLPGTQSARLLPLAFAAVAVVIGYWLARQLGWRLRAAAVCAGVLAGAGVLLEPAMLIRDDLKQYTADACLSLLVLALTSRLEREWSLRRLAALSVAAWGGMLFSQAVTFVGIAAFGALCIVALARRSWRRLAQSCAAAAITGILMFGLYKLFDQRAVTAGLIDGEHMRYYFIPLDSWHDAVSFVGSHFAAAAGFFNLGPVWLAVPLVVAGIVTIFRLGKPVTALAVVLLWPVALAVNAVRRYPFLDERTNTYLFVITAAVAAIGVAGLSSWLPRVVRGAGWLLREVARAISPLTDVPARAGSLLTAMAARARAWLALVLRLCPRPLRRRVSRATAMTAWLCCACVFAVAAFGWTARPYVRTHQIPSQNVGGQTHYVLTHESSDDVILVDTGSAFGFAYYWPVGMPGRRPDNNVAQEYEPYFPSQPRIVVSLSGSDADTENAVSDAVAQSRSRSCARIWFITAQESPSRWAAWAAALARRGLSATSVTGVTGLYVIRVTGPGCR